MSMSWGDGDAISLTLPITGDCTNCYETRGMKLLVHVIYGRGSRMSRRLVLELLLDFWHRSVV